jgi:hypothetical protein
MRCAASWRSALLAVLLTTGLTLATPAVFKPWWSSQLNGEPQLVRWLGPAANGGRAAVGLRPNRLCVIDVGATTPVWEGRVPDSIVDIAALPDAGGGFAVAGPGRIVAFNAQCRPRWQTALGEHSVRRLLAGDVNGDGQAELVAVADTTIIVIAATGRILGRFRGHWPALTREAFQVEVADIDRDRCAEIVVCAAHRLAVFRATGEQLINLDLGEDAHTPPGPDLSCRRFAICPGDSAAGVDIVAVATGSGRARPALLWLDGRTRLLKREQYLGQTDSLEPRLLTMVGTRPYTTCRTSKNEWRLCRHDSSGAVERYLPFSRFLNLASVADLFEVVQGNRTVRLSEDRVPVLLLRWKMADSLDGLSILAADPDWTGLPGLGYSGVRVADLQVADINNDSLDDLLVLRTSPTGARALDAFVNNSRKVNAEFEQARAAVVAAGDAGARRRAARRLELMARRLGRSQQVAPLLPANPSRRRHPPLSLLAAALLALVTLAAAVLMLVRRLARGRIPAAGLAGGAHQLMIIANDIIAIDHVYVAKGHATGAIGRIKDMRTRYGLESDPDLSRVLDQLEPYYSRFIRRLINEPKRVKFHDWIVDAVRLMGRQNELSIVTWTKEELEQQMRSPQLTGHWLVRVQNWDCPDIHERFQLYHDPRSAAFFEHWLSDNFRYARNWSAVVMEYAVNTTWNRKMTVRFLNDGPGTIDITRPRSNIAAQLSEVVRGYPGFLELARQPAELGRHEKIWLRIWDFISILEDIHVRQTGVSAAGPTPE